MRNISFLIIVVGAFVLYACEKEHDFKYEFADVKVEEIDSISFSPGHHVLIANGENTLEMVVELYRTVQYTNAKGVLEEMKVWVDPSHLPQDIVNIVHLERGQTLQGNKFSTDDIGAGIATFYAKVGDIQSESKTVLLKAPVALPEKRVIDIIFHVFELSPDDPLYNKYSTKEITSDLLEAAVKDLNEVFNKELSQSSASASTNIEFRLAVSDPNGQKLLDPGFHKYYYMEDDLKALGGSLATLDADDFREYVNQNSAAFIWDPEKYANVIVQPASADYVIDTYPLYQIVPDGGMEMEGMGIVINDESELPESFTTTKPFYSYCISASKGVFFPGEDRRISLCQEFGRFWGVRTTMVSNPVTLTDYCTDTRKWWLYEPIPGTTKYNPTKLQNEGVVCIGWDGYRFKRNNFMDDIRYSSLRNTITSDQVQRIRYALDNCPGRRPGRIH